MRAELERFPSPTGELAIGWRHAQNAATAVQTRLDAETYANERERGNAASLAWSRHYFGLAANKYVDDIELGTHEISAALASLGSIATLAIAPGWCQPVARVLDRALENIQRLRVLAIDWLALTDVIKAIAMRPRPHLHALEIGVADYVEQMHSGDFYPFAWEHGPVVAIDIVRRLATATPQLRELTLVGNRIFAGLEHPAIERLELIGDPVDGCLFEPDTPENCEPILKIPRVRTIVHTGVRDEYRPYPTRPLAITSSSAPALRQLVLQGEYGFETHSPFGAIGQSAILPQLEFVAFPALYDGLDRDVLDELGPRYQHLASLAVREVLAEKTGPDSEDLQARIRSALPNLTLGRTSL